MTVRHDTRRLDEPTADTAGVRLARIALIVALTLVALKRLQWAFIEHVRAGGLDLYLFRHSADCLWSGSCAAYAPLQGYAPNLLSPPAHAIFWPLFGLSHFTAYLCLLVLFALSMVSSAWLIAKTLNLTVRPWQWGLITVVILGSGFVMGNVRTGQVYLLMLLPVTLAWRWDRSRRHAIAAGSMLGILTIMKPLLLLFLPWWLLRRRWNTAASMAVTITCLLAIGVVLFGWQTYVDYAASLTRAANSGSYPDGSIFQTMTRNFGAPHRFAPVAYAPALAGYLTACLLILVAGVTFWRAKDGDQGWLAILSAALLLAPKGWLQATPWLMGPAVAVSLTSRGAQRWLLIVFFALATCPEYWPLVGQPNPWLTPLLGSMVFWMFLSCWAAAVLSRPK